MKLSFCIPAYNEEKQIAGCLESIMIEMKGAGHNIEIVVVNNASTDRTKEVAEAFAGVVVIDEMKKGLVSARAAGYRFSSGELVANIDADTRLTPGWIDKVFWEFQKDKNLVALSGPYIYYDLSLSTRMTVKVFYVAGYLFHIFNHFVLGQTAMLQGGNFIVKREAMEKIGGFSKEFDFYGEETDTAMRIQKVGRVKFTFALPMYTSGRRLKKEGIIATGWRYALNHFWAIIFKKPFTKSYKDIRE